MAEPTEFLRGYATESLTQPASRVPAEFATSLPADTVSAAEVTAGVRLELRGTAPWIDVRFRATAGSARAAPTMPAAFSVWIGTRHHGLVEVAPGDTSARIILPHRSEDTTVTVYLPDPVAVHVVELSAPEGTLRPAPRGPRWLAYGDSITQGWSATDPGLAWPALLARRTGLDVVNLGFAGAARGEYPAAAHLAAAHADLMTLAWGTNCWSTVAFDAALIRQVCRIFLTTVRAGHPDVPIVFLSPLVRPDAETTPNRFGATLAVLRDAIESEVDRFRTDHADPALWTLPGLPLVGPGLLVDGIHPGDLGHDHIADAVGKLLPDLPG